MRIVENTLSGKRLPTHPASHGDLREAIVTYAFAESDEGEQAVSARNGQDM
mgnify:CR=1 FL=1